MFRWSQDEQGEWTGVDGAHWFKVRIEGDRLEVESNGEEAAFRSLFRLDWDAAEVERRIVAKAPELEPYVGSLRGLRLLRPSDPSEAFFCFLCTPNNNLTRITRMIGHLATYGPILRGALHRFPSAEQVAAIPESALRENGFGYRARTIPSLANQVLERGGEPWLKGLKQVPYAEARASLIELNGIGPKLADCICLFALHHEESVPIDTHMWQAVCRLYLPDLKEKPLTDVRYDEAAAILRNKLGKLAGWGHQFLFYENLLNWRSRRSAGTLSPSP